MDWSVDDGMPSVIPATLSLAMSGYGLTHSDVGGYTTIMHMTRGRELLMRWEEMNVFSAASTTVIEVTLWGIMIAIIWSSIRLRLLRKQASSALSDRVSEV